MKTIIEGENYNFYILADGIEFYIKALHLASLRYSFINNLNAVLSEFNISGDDKRASESQWWITSKKQNDLFFKEATGFLLDKNYRDYIEKRLDEDRKCGEWENFYKIKSRNVEKSEKQKKLPAQRQTG